ncbi:peptidylprolyl isomerase SurA [Pseudoalteromonas xiamenensis]
MNLKKIILGVCLSLSVSQAAIAQRVELDRVVATVNNGVILKSEVDVLVARVKKNADEQGTELPSEETLRVQAIDRLVDKEIMMQLAGRMGLEISDAQLDQTLTNIAQEQGGTLADLRKTIELSGESYASYREDIRREITTGQVMRANVDRRIYVSPQEIDNLIKIMETQGGNNEEYDIGHILIKVPAKATADEIQAERDRADNVLKLLNKGEDFRRIAIASSSGAKALDGGQLGWMGINDMPTLFAEAVKGKKKGEVIGPLRSGAGFHIIKIQDIRGQQLVETTEVRSRHILIKPSIILSEEKAKTMLEGFLKDLREGKADFAELAKKHSEDPGSALKGGEYDWTDPNTYVPAFRDTLASLEKGQISEPFRTTYGWHIVQLLDKRTADKTEIAKRNRAHGILFNRKFKEESFKWQNEMREQAHVEVLPADK